MGVHPAAYFYLVIPPTSTVVIMKVDELVSGPALQQVSTPGPT